MIRNLIYYISVILITIICCIIFPSNEIWFILTAVILYGILLSLPYFDNFGFRKNNDKLKK